MDRNTEVTLGDVYTGMTNAIQAAFPSLHVEAEREDRKPPTVDACLLELSEMVAAPGHDPGTEQLAMLACFEAHLIVHFRRPDGKSAKREAAEMAGALAAFARLNRWGCKIGPAEVTGAYRDDFTADLDQYEAWRVEWQQVIHLGETVWTAGERPTQIMLGIAPLIGPGHEPDYFPVDALPVLP